MNDAYSKITDFSFVEKFMFLMENKPLFVIVLVLLIFSLMCFVTGLIIMNNSAIREKFNFSFRDDEDWFYLFFIPVILVFLSGVLSLIYMITISDSMSENNIENNITDKYGYSDAVLWDTVNEDQGVYLVTVFDEESLKREVREFWFDSETYEPTISELDSEGVGKILTQIDMLAKEDKW